jgi:glycosyltransferase involved in cell wall biosynthesis
VPLFAPRSDPQGIDLTVIGRRAIGTHARAASELGLGCVLHIGPDPRGVGGIASVIRELLRTEPAHNVALASSSWSPRSRSRGLTHIPQCVGAVWRLRIASLSRGNGVVHVHLSEGGSFLREGAIVAWASLLRLPTVATLHGADFPAFAAKRRRTVRFVLRRAEIVLTLGPRTTELLLRLAPELRVIETLNPVAIRPTQSPADHDRPEGAYVLFAGELSERKGLDRLLAAWPAVVEAAPGYRLLLCGPTADIPLDALPEGVEVLGPRSHDETLHLIAQASLVCLPSRREVLPMVLLEAAVRGVPAVATEVGEIGVLRASGGITIVPPEPRAIAEALVGLLREPDQRRAMGARSTDWAHRHASSSAVRDSLDCAYEEAARRRRAL